MEIITKNLDGAEKQYISVEFLDIYTKKKKRYLFKDFTIDEFKKVKALPSTEVEEGTVAQIINPTVYMINAMMVEGEKLTGNEPMYILNKLKKELADFL